MNRKCRDRAGPSRRYVQMPEQAFSSPTLSGGFQGPVLGPRYEEDSEEEGGRET